MSRLWDKAVLFIVIILFITVQAGVMMPIVALLAALTGSGLGQCFEETKLAAVLQAVYVGLCFLNPYFCMTLALVLYDIVRSKRRWLMGISVIPVFIQIQNCTYREGIFVLAMIFITLILENRTQKLDEAQKNLIEVRDNSQEVTMLLTEKNRRLCESQDYEIYLATLKERNRIAREIHDNVGHMLTRTILQMGALIVINKDEAQREGLESVKNTLNDAMTSIRQSVHDLHDESVDLRQAVNEAVKSVSEKFQVTSEFDFSDVIPRNIKFAIIGIVKEGLNNAVKHSNGNRIYLSIQEHPAFYQLIVEDNGSNSGKISESGIGLSNMKDRVNNLGGIIRIDSSEKGFRIFVSMPKNKGSY